MAWLDATPEKQKLPRRTKLELDRKGGTEPPELEPPELEPTLEYLVGYLFQVGPFIGEHELTFGEMRDWCELSGATLDDFESMALKQMSRAYLGMSHAARKEDCPFPAVAVEADEDSAEEAARQDKLDAQLKAVFGAMAAAPKDKAITRKGRNGS